MIYLMISAISFLVTAIFVYFVMYVLHKDTEDVSVSEVDWFEWMRQNDPIFLEIDNKRIELEERRRTELLQLIAEAQEEKALALGINLRLPFATDWPGNYKTVREWERVTGKKWPYPYPVSYE